MLVCELMKGQAAYTARFLLVSAHCKAAEAVFLLLSVSCFEATQCAAFMLPVPPVSSWIRGWMLSIQKQVCCEMQVRYWPRWMCVLLSAVAITVTKIHWPIRGWSVNYNPGYSGRRVIFMLSFPKHSWFVHIFSWDTLTQVHSTRQLKMDRDGQYWPCKY